ncbi:hypothetical protein [Nitrososphaera sp. AFS]|uniref:hypothetical protein n=1 Tax=Nitrososphaera sp. AFS TaxID=2301191 RepID=UPI0013924945|nr:hypothetical protein [Nitrososphaera sp. AFS]NAL78410.1 hypothetical protein [Nitrososphaera sp. AFS]
MTITSEQGNGRGRGGEYVPISYGLAFICNLFKQDNSFWPKFVCAGDRWRLTVQDKSEALAYFYQARKINCRISPFPQFVQHYRKPDVRDCMAIGGEGIVPNFVMIDLDLGRFSRTLLYYKEDALNRALDRILARINEKFHGTFRPMISLVYKSNPA